MDWASALLALSLARLTGAEEICVSPFVIHNPSCVNKFSPLMIVSYDTIISMVRPPFQISSKILYLAGSIQEIIGEFKSYSAVVPPVKLRRENRIKTVHHSLAIEGNSLSEDKITAILENKRVLGPKAQILEVKNALELYESLAKLNPLFERDLLRAHKALMKDLIPSAGKFRSTAVGVLKGTTVSHVAPPAKQVPVLMAQLFQFLTKDTETIWLIKACVFHYELEFIHPFADGNGRMGRLWQQLCLMKQSSIFEFISAESIVHKRQHEYYKVLEKCDKLGDSTLFIEFSLESILASLVEFRNAYHPSKPKASDRIAQALEYFGKNDFSRKDYLSLHKGLSTATASRDLNQAVNADLLGRLGDKSKARYSRK